MHVQSSYLSRPLVMVVPLYESGPARWTDYKERRPG